MDENRYYFAGDPATDSSRRLLQRVLEEPAAPRRHWPWIVGALAGGGTWTLWRMLQRRRQSAEDQARGVSSSMKTRR